MTVHEDKHRHPRGPALPKELVGIVAFTLAIFLVVLSGATISGSFDHPSPWLFAASYAGPSGIAFALYWWISRRL